MRKKVFGKQLSRGKKAREALFRSLLKAQIEYGKIVTTKAKAKAIQRDLEKLIILAKNNSLSAKRKISAWLGNDRKFVSKVVKEITPFFKDKKSGFTRIILLPPRRGDAAEMARIEWTEEIASKKKETSDKRQVASNKQSKSKLKSKKTEKSETKEK
jgi:large subunit ribosomal protein L17